MHALVLIRYSLDTQNGFYREELAFGDHDGPVFEKSEQLWMAAVFASPFRGEFEALHGEHLFLNIAYGGIYRTRRKLDDGIPFYAEGEAWQSTKHIYAWPFWFIDCALSQIVALQFWAMMREDFENAWKHYMAYTMQGGSRTFLDLLKYADLQSSLTRIV